TSWAMKTSMATAHGANIQHTDAYGFQSSPPDGRRTALVTGFGLPLGDGHGLTMHLGDLLRSIMGDGCTSAEYGAGLLDRLAFVRTTLLRWWRGWAAAEQESDGSHWATASRTFRRTT